MATNVIEMNQEKHPLVIERVAPPLLPAKAERCFREGIEQLGLGEPEQARIAFELALEQAPGFADAHVGMGIAHALCSDVYRAIDHLQAAIELAPASFYAHFKLSQLYFKLRVPGKGYAEAKLALRSAAEWDERRLLAQLLREERARERDGIGRPWWNRPFGASALVAGATTAILAVAALMMYLR
jgi:tetratricopeptide (TPR) repeat protein